MKKRIQSLMLLAVLVSLVLGSVPCAQAQQNPNPVVCGDDGKQCVRKYVNDMFWPLDLKADAVISKPVNLLASNPQICVPPLLVALETGAKGQLKTEAGLMEKPLWWIPSAQGSTSLLGPEFLFASSDPAPTSEWQALLHLRKWGKQRYDLRAALAQKQRVPAKASPARASEHKSRRRDVAVRRDFSLVSLNLEALADKWLGLVMWTFASLLLLLFIVVVFFIARAASRQQKTRLRKETFQKDLKEAFEAHQEEIKQHAVSVLKAQIQENIELSQRIMAELEGRREERRRYRSAEKRRAHEKAMTELRLAIARDHRAAAEAEVQIVSIQAQADIAVARIEAEAALAVAEVAAASRFAVAEALTKLQHADDFEPVTPPATETSSDDLPYWRPDCGCQGQRHSCKDFAGEKIDWDAHTSKGEDPSAEKPEIEWELRPPCGCAGFRHNCEEWAGEEIDWSLAKAGDEPEWSTMAEPNFNSVDRATRLMREGEGPEHDTFESILDSMIKAEIQEGQDKSKPETDSCHRCAMLKGLAKQGLALNPSSLIDPCPSCGNPPSPKKKKGEKEGKGSMRPQLREDVAENRAESVRAVMFSDYCARERERHDQHRKTGSSSCYCHLRGHKGSSAAMHAALSLHLQRQKDPLYGLSDEEVRELARLHFVSG